MRTSSAAVSALSVKRSRDGGQSRSTLSYNCGGSFSRARLSLNSRARLDTSSTSAPTRFIVAGATSNPSMLVSSATSCRGLPSSSTSYMHPPESGATPRPLVALPCGSMSTTSTLSPLSARYAARLIAVVLFPTPPFWFTMATTVFTAGILARAPRAFLLTPYLVASSRAPPPYGGTPAASRSLSRGSRDAAPWPRSRADEAPGVPPKPSLPVFPPRVVLQTTHPAPTSPSWRSHGPRSSAAVRSTRLPPIAGPQPAPLQRRTPPGRSSRWRPLPPWRSLLLPRSTQASRWRGARSAPSFRWIRPGWPLGWAARSLWQDPEARRQNRHPQASALPRVARTESS